MLFPHWFASVRTTGPGWWPLLALWSAAAALPGHGHALLPQQLIEQQQGAGVAAQVPADPLARLVQLPATTAPLENILRLVAKQAGVSLSYSPTRLPLRTRVTVGAGPAVPLRTALATLTRGRPILWALLEDNQLVMWPQGERPPAGLVAQTGSRPQILPLPTVSPAGSRTASSRSASTGQTATRGQRAGSKGGEVVAGPLPSAEPVGRTTRPPARSAAARRGKSYAPHALPPATSPPELPAFAPRHQREIPLLVAQPVAVKASSAASAPARDSARYAALGAELPLVLPVRLPEPALAPAAPAWEHRRAQVSLVPPLSTSLLANARTVNQFSLNLLVGYSAGVSKLEVGGLANLVRDSVQGVQVAGVFNSAGGPLNGLQAAGLVNVLGGPLHGAQAAGLVNAASSSLDGVQLAGLVNVARGPAQGWQNAGLVNVLAAGTDGAAPAVEPLVQLAGLANIATATMHGAQMAPLLNVANKIKGVQLAGLLNIADSVAGVSLAPFNFVRHGYHTLELLCGNTWPFSLALKLGGSAPFYTYFVGVLRPGGANRRWGLGYGIGSELGASRRLSLTLEAQGVQVNEDDNSRLTWGRELNMHTQFRLPVGWATGSKRRLRLLVGPAVNVLVTERGFVATGVPDSGVISDDNATFTDLSTSGRTRVKGWLEVVGGVRWRF